jgi:cbb3-type cytochrome oxidase cytochrome c subunit
MHKRILVLLSVVALMVVMLATTVAPAFAKRGIFLCTNPTTGDQVFFQAKFQNKHIWIEQGFTECHPAP